MSLKTGTPVRIKALVPDDITGNSLALSPVTGDTNPTQIAVTTSTGSTVFRADAAGNVTAAGTLAAGASTLGAVTASSVSTPSLTASTSSVAANASVGGNLSVTGTLTAGALTAAGTNIGGDQTIAGNDTVNGNLVVKGSTTVQALSAASQQVSGTSSLGAVTCTSLSDTGNASVTGTLNVGGGTTTQAISATTVTTSGALRSNANLVVSGGADVGSLNSNGDALVQGKLTVNKGAQVLGTFTGSGNAVVTGTLTAGATTVDSLVANGNIRTEGNFTASSGSANIKTLTASTASVVGNTTTGSLNVTGTSTLGTTNAGALTASSSSVANNATVGGTLGVTGTSTLAAVNATNVAASGTLSAAGASTLAALTASSASVANNATIGGTLGVTGATSAAALTSTGTVTAKNLTLTSGSGGVLTFADGTTMATAATGTGGGTGGTSASTGTGSAVLDFGFYWPNAGAYPTSLTVNQRTITSGSTVATVPAVNTMQSAGSITGLHGFIFNNTGGKNYTFTLYKNGVATAMTATANSTTSTAIGPNLNGTIYQSSASLTAVNYVAGDVLQVFSMAESGASSQATYSFASYAIAGNSQVARAAFDMGGYQYNPLTAGAYAPTKKANQTAGTANAQTNYDLSVRMPWAGSIVGFSLQQNVSSVGNNSIAYIKNGTQLTAVTNVGSGAGNFWGTHAVTSFPFAAGDKIQLATTISNSGNTDVFGQIYVQWTDAASASPATVTNNPSFNSLTVAAVAGETLPALVTTPSLTLTSGGGGKLTFADGTSMTTAASGGSASAAAKSAIFMGFWASAAGAPSTTPTPLRLNYSNGNPAVLDNVVFTPDYAGSALSFTGWIDGFTNTQYTLVLQKNGNNTGISASINIPNGGGASTFSSNKQSVGTTTFAPGDFFQIKISAASGATARTVQASMTIVYNA